MDVILNNKLNKLNTKLKNAIKDLLQLANNIYMRNGVDANSIALLNSNTVEFVTNTTYGNLGFAIPNTQGNKYICVSIVKNVGTVNSPITRRQIAYNNSLSASASTIANGTQVGTSVTLNAGQSVTFIDKFVSELSGYTAISLGISPATSGVKLKVTQMVYDVTTLDSDIVDLQMKSVNANYAETSNMANSLEETYKQSLISYSADAINCWGDSLTRGVGGTIPYPQVLATLTGKTVYNMGIGGENTAQISARQGGNPIWVNNITIPAGTTPVQIGTYATSGLVDDFGNNIRFLLQGGGVHPSVNPCTIAGVEGTLTWTGSTPSDSNGTFTFTRTTAGSAVTINRPTLLVTYAMKNRRENITVFWTGTNDMPDGTTVQDVIYKQRAMIDYLKTKKYIVVGMSSKSYMPDIVAVNDKLRKEYGFRFLDIRKYLLNYGLSDAGITPTTQDNTDIANGEIPTSLRSDEVHFIDATYNIIANLIYKKLKDLGYVN